MPESILICKQCGYRFNYLWTSGGSIHAVRLGSVRSFRCPKCQRRSRFDLQTRGHSPTLRSFDDTFHATSLLLLVGPVVAAAILTTVLTHLFPRTNPLVAAGPVLVGLGIVISYATIMIWQGTIPEAHPEAIQTQ